MDLALSDQLSITALSISLVALLVTVITFTQTVLGTAEGYRRCASSVIGPWSALRRREIRWRELRVETKFVTPLIVLVSDYEIARADLDKDADDIYSLNTATEDTRHYSVWSGLLVWKKRYYPGKVLNDSMHLPSAPRITSNSDNLAKLSSDGHVEGDSTEKGVITETGRDKTAESRKLLKEWGRKRKTAPRNGLPVTWIDLLRELHLLYRNYWPHEHHLCEEEDQPGEVPERNLDFDPYALSALMSNMVKHSQSRRWDNTMRTRVAMIPCEETWDFMPADVSRPLASSTLGHIIVMTMRLGMQWRSREGTQFQLNADGGGMSINSIDVKGLGVVLKFNASTRRDRVDLVIPSRAADKMMCGILPGDPDLVRRDWDMVNREREVLPHYHSGGVLVTLGLSEEAIAFIAERHRWETHNDVVTLLCPFLPLPCSPLYTYYYPGWKGGQHSVFHFYECRLGLLNALRRETTKSSSTILVTVRDALEDLLTDFAYEFFDGYYEPPNERRTALQRKITLIDRCRAQFDSTTDYFKRNGYHQTNNSDKTWYMQLVAAHARLSANALKRAFDAIEKRTETSGRWGQTRILQENESIIKESGVQTTYWAERLYDMAVAYAEDVTNHDYGVVSYMRERSFPASHEQIKEAWWMLMLRGLVWDLSCKCLEYPGQPVPSSYYGDETTVWIT